MIERGADKNTKFQVQFKYTANLCTVGEPR
jgi:hypothetical protein